MFYSHEILTSRQYGVATIWLIATVGAKSSSRKLTRKAIQQVNVRGACEKIIDPGAPMALRLQSSLLYGVSRVYSQQCTYVLADAEKVQSDMKAFYRMITVNETDPQAGRAKRHQIIIEDDPAFIPDNNIPKFDFDDEGNITFSRGRNSSSKSSQLSQFTLENSRVSSSGGDAIIGINLSQSSRGSYALPSPFGPPSSVHKPIQAMNPFEDPEDLVPIGGFDLDIDADGNLIGIIDPELELPPLPLPIPQDQQHPIEQEEPVGHVGGQILDGENDVPMMDEEALPDAEAFQVPGQPEQQQHQEIGSIRATAPIRRRRPSHQAASFVDENPELSRAVIRSWQERDVAVQEGGRKTRHTVGVAQARRNAYDLTFGFGISNVGQATGIHGIMQPLAEIFAGEALRERILGIRAEDEVPSTPAGQRRRSASDAFEEEDGEEGRNVRQRIEEPNQADLGGMGDLFGDDTVPEIGMDAAPPMDDHLSSSIMPWNRTPSVAPPSVRSQQHRPGSRQLTASPRGSIVQPIERLSDVAGADPGSDGFQPPHSLGSSFENFGPAAAVDTQQAEDSQWMRAALDTASGEFLGYAKEQAKEKGEAKVNDKQENRRWVGFEELADPAKHTKIVAAQAFYHVLTLATKNAISVEQGVLNNQPFGQIKIGVDLTEESKPGDD